MASQQQYDGLDNTKSEADLNASSEQSTCGKCMACPGFFANFLYHDGLFCSLSPSIWCQLWTFLISLWIVSGLFWYLMWYFVVIWPVKALWAFLVCWGLFTALFVVLMALDIDDSDDIDNLGCTEKELQDHITGLMDSNMTWDTFGSKWHIIHKTELHEDNPSAELNARVVQVCQRMHYTNTMPVWSNELTRGSFTKPKVNPATSSKKKAASKKNKVAPLPSFEEAVQTTITTTTEEKTNAVDNILNINQ